MLENNFDSFIKHKFSFNEVKARWSHELNENEMNQISEHSIFLFLISDLTNFLNNDFHALGWFTANWIKFKLYSITCVPCLDSVVQKSTSELWTRLKKYKFGKYKIMLYIRHVYWGNGSNCIRWIQSSNDSFQIVEVLGVIVGALGSLGLDFSSYNEKIVWICKSFGYVLKRMKTKEN